MKRIVKWMALGLVATMAMSGCSSNASSSASSDASVEAAVELTEINISEFRGLNWIVAYVAEAKGFFEEEGLHANYILYDDGPVAFQGMHGGDSDFCLLSQEPVLKAAEEGLESSIIYTALDTRLYGLVSAPDITSIADLKGSVIFAGMPGSSPYSFVSSILREADIDPEKDVTFVTMDYTASMMALEQGQIQGSYLNVDNRVEILDMDVNMLVDTAEPEAAATYLQSEVFPGEIICCTTKFAEENPETVQAFVNAISKATEWMNESTAEEIAEVISSYYEGMELDSLAQKIEILMPAFTVTGEISEDAEAAVQQFCMSTNVIIEEIPYDQVINMEFVNAYQGTK